MKRSDIFWASILALSLILLYAFIKIILFLVIWIFCGSIAMFALPTKKGHKLPLWTLLFPLVWLFLIIDKLIRISIIFYQKVVVPFNKKLNGEK
jgi:hypothetical protein